MAEFTSPEAATRVLKRGQKLRAEVADFIEDAQTAAASALTQRELPGTHRLYSVEVIGYTTAWTFEQVATPEQAQEWREDGLHVEEMTR